nr:hypothetical protein Q903MT_gene2675 [Picea sitchensis]
MFPSDDPNCLSYTNYDVVGNSIDAPSFFRFSYFRTRALSNLPRWECSFQKGKPKKEGIEMNVEM